MAVTAWLMLSLAWITADHFPPWTSFHSEAPAFAATVVALLGCSVACRKAGRNIVLPAALLLPLFLILTVVLQWLLGHIVYGGDALVASIYLLAFAIAWAWGYQWAHQEAAGRLLETICAAFLFAGMVTSWQVLAQWLLVEGSFYGWVLDAGMHRKPTGNLGQPNLTGTLLMMASVAAAILAARRRFGTAVLLLVLLVFGWAIVLTQSRTAILSAIVLSAGYFIFNYPNRSTRLKSTIVFLWPGSLVVAGLFFQHLNIFEALGAAKQGVGIQSMVTAGGRPVLWMQLLIGLSESPWVGYGWLQISHAHQAGAMHLPAPMQTNYGHNILLDLVLVLGWPIGLLILALVAWWLRRRIPALVSHSDPVQALFLLVPFLVHAQLELPHASAYFLIPAGVLMGAIDAWTCPKNGVGWRISWAACLVFAVAWGGLLGAVAYEYMEVEEDFRINRFENRRLGKTPDDYEIPRIRLLTQMDEMLRSMRLRADRNMEQDDLEILKRASRRYIWAPLQYRTALALALNEQPEESEKHLLTIKRMFPPDVYEEGRTSWLQMQQSQYPELSQVRLP